jgi:hypothetical protein
MGWLAHECERGCSVVLVGAFIDEPWLVEIGHAFGEIAANMREGSGGHFGAASGVVLGAGLAFETREVGMVGADELMVEVVGTVWFADD